VPPPAVSSALIPDSSFNPVGSPHRLHLTHCNVPQGLVFDPPVERYRFPFIFAGAHGYGYPGASLISGFDLKSCKSSYELEL
jgi:hypothetical protein